MLVGVEFLSWESRRDGTYAVLRWEAEVGVLLLLTAWVQKWQVESEKWKSLP